MLKLIKLEWKKNNIGKYIRNAVILAALICLFIFGLTFWGMAIDPDTGTLDAPPGYDVISCIIELISNMSFICFTGTMLASFIVSAYKNKTMNLMFSYPVKRQKILISQMLAVWIFNFTALALTKLFIYICILLGSRCMQSAFKLDFNIGSLTFYLQLFISSAVMVSTGYIALFIGLITKSSKAAVIASVVIMFLTHGNIGELTLANNTVFFAVLVLISLIFAILSIYDAETKDLV